MKRFHGVSAGNVHEYLLKSRIGKARDSCLVVFYEKNMRDLDFIIKSYISQPFIAIIVISIVSFLFINTFFFPVIRYSIKRFITLPLYIHVYLRYIETDYQRSDNSRDILAVEAEAIRNQDKFTLERVEKMRESLFQMERFDDEVFTFTCLLAINIWFVGSPENPSISQALIRFIEQIDSFIIRLTTHSVFWIFVLLFLWIAIQGLIPREETIYAPRTVNKQSTSP